MDRQQCFRYSEILFDPKKGMNYNMPSFENTELIEKSQTEQDKYQMIPIMRNI